MRRTRPAVKAFSETVSLSGLEPMSVAVPRLNHKKARTGCQRCKARKVKVGTDHASAADLMVVIATASFPADVRLQCDELKPRCSACTRHNVSCEYVEPARRRTAGPPSGSTSHSPFATDGRIGEPQGLDPMLEIRLMHEWTAYTCQSFSNSSEFWRIQAPLFALEHRVVMDAMFALAALHLSKKKLGQWTSSGGQTVPLRDPTCVPQSAAKDLMTHYRDKREEVNDLATVRNGINEPFAGTRSNTEMLLNARKYFDRALDGHNHGIQTASKENIEAVYITSMLVSFHALFTLNETEEDALTSPSVDPLLWLGLSRGTRHVCRVWQEFVGEEWLDTTGVYFGRSKCADEDSLFQREQGKPFEGLLTFAEEYEQPTPEDKDAFSSCLAYIAFIYKSIVEDTEIALANCRRIAAMPSRLPERFTVLVEHRNPRALVMLAHVFALTKLISDRVPWFQGLAERQIPKIQQQLPAGWHELMAWPSKVAAGKFELSANEVDVRFILSL